MKPMRHSPTALAYFVLVLTTLSWGGNAVAGKLAVGHISPMVLTTLRWIVAVVVLAVMSRQQWQRDWPVLKRHLWLFLFYGAIGFTFFNVMFYSALHFTTTINVSIEQAGIPMMIFVINFVVWRTKVSPAQIIGFGLTLLGVTLTASHGDLKRLIDLAVNLGDGLMLLAVAAYAFYTVSLRWRPQLDWRSIMLAMALAALVSSLPLLIWEMASGHAQWPDAGGVGVVLYTGILASIVSQALYIKGVDLIGANRAGLFINLVPVFGTLLSILMLGERMESFHVVALVMTLGGIAIAELGRPKA